MMMHPPRLGIRWICPIAVAVLGVEAPAAVTLLANGNFEEQVTATSAEIQSVSSWFESATPADGSGYQDWLFRTSASVTMAGNLTNLFALSTTTGYLYQRIGTYTSGERVIFSGDAYKRAAAGSQFTGVTVELLSGNFSGADNTPLVATLLATQTLTAAGLGLPTSGATSATSPFSVVLDSGASGVNGTDLWIRISKPNAGGEVFLDNLSVVPEPSVALIAGVGLLGLLRRRRER